MGDGVSSHATSSGRRKAHTRRITCEAYRRDDGLYEIEASLQDVKPHACHLPERTVPAGEPIHEMSLCVTIDGRLAIRGAEARMSHSPHRVCGDIAQSYRQLVGLTIGPGFTKTVKRMFRATLGCSHLTELLPIIATTALQTLWTERHMRGATASDFGDAPGSSPIDGCHALRSDGETARRHLAHVAALAESRGEGGFGAPPGRAKPA
jgi:hypothetical protein